MEGAWAWVGCPAHTSQLLLSQGLSPAIPRVVLYPQDQGGGESSQLGAWLALASAEH